MNIIAKGLGLAWKGVAQSAGFAKGVVTGKGLVASWKGMTMAGKVTTGLAGAHVASRLMGPHTAMGMGVPPGMAAGFGMHGAYPGAYGAMPYYV